MAHDREVGKMEHKSKDGSETKVFDALEWMAGMYSHVPNKGEQIVFTDGPMDRADATACNKMLYCFP